MKVAVLFAREDSIYKKIAGCDVYDIERDARTFPGGLPIVAHPPCRAWGNLRTFAKPRDDEKALAPWVIDQIRQFGGVLEHPKGSSLWPTLGLPSGLGPDLYGGFTIHVDQFWWGHKAKKSTQLYICGCTPAQIPIMPLKLGEATHVIARHGRMPNGQRVVKGMPRWRPETSKAEREETPPDFALWLVALASRCKQVSA
jgi:hypothetical protein